MRFNNDQEVFEHVKNHLLTQNAVSRLLSPAGYVGIDPSTCAYRGIDGRKCAIGCLITDEAYSTALERKNMWDDAVLYALQASGVPELVMYSPLWIMLKSLQKLHDNNAPTDWPAMLETYKFHTDGTFILPTKE